MMLASFTVLVVEDSATLCYAYRQALGNEFRLIFADNPLGALNAMLEVRPDLVVLDVDLKASPATGNRRMDRGVRRLSGLDICTIIKRSPLGDTPIILCSGHDGLLDHLRGRRAGANRYIDKPVAMDELCEAVRELLSPRIIKARLRHGEAFQRSLAVV